MRRVGLATKAIVAVAVTVSLLSSTACSSSATAPSSRETTTALRKKYPEPIDLARARAKCLESKGWVVSVTSDAGISANLDPGTEDSYNRDDEACLKKLGADFEGLPAESLLRTAFAKSKEGAACLRRGGWPISKDPTYETFKDTYLSDVWFPWAEVPAGEEEEALKLCPGPEPDY
jgi:hypothetical protein